MKKNGRIKRLLGALVLVLFYCSYSSPALSYTQQYNVGDTGPNGGTVTSSTVTSVVTNTEVTLNGGFEDTTTTTQWTETVVEEIATSTTTTQQVSQITATTTSNFVPTIIQVIGQQQVE